MGVAQSLIWGEFEDFVAREEARVFVAAAKAAGDDARLIDVAGIGHFETATPKSKAWPTVNTEIRRMLGMNRMKR